MRILQVTPYYAPAWAYGGPPRVMREYAVGLVQRGHDVEVLTTDVLDAGRRARPLRERLDGVAVTRVPNLSNSLAWRRKKYLPPGLVPALARRARGADVVHATDTRTFVTAAAYLAARRARVPLVLSAHGTLPGSAGVRGAVKDVYDSALVRPMLRRAAALLAQTEHEAELYERLGARSERIAVLPLPLAEPPAVGATARADFRRRTGVGDEQRMILFLGRIHRLKGLDVLVEAAAPLLEADPALVLVVVGRDDGGWAELAARHERLAARGSLRLAGALYGDERFAAYAAADVFALTPPHWEETSLASLEAGASGTALVLSEQASIPGLEPRHGGFVVPLDRERIREALRRALAAPGELGARAREFVLARHAAPAVVDRLEGLLEEARDRA